MIKYDEAMQGLSLSKNIVFMCQESCTQSTPKHIFPIL